MSIERCQTANFGRQPEHSFTASERSNDTSDSVAVKLADTAFIKV